MTLTCLPPVTPTRQPELSTSASPTPNHPNHPPPIPAPPSHPPPRPHTMVFAATRRFLRRNRTPLLLTTAIAGASYLTITYITSKLTSAKSRLHSERIAREKSSPSPPPSIPFLTSCSINRRFQQNQEDSTYTTLALLPTLSTSLHTTYPTETHTSTLQSRKTARLSSTPTPATDSDALSTTSSTT